MTDATLATVAPIRWQNAMIIERRVRTQNIASFFIRPATPFQWHAGQHIDVRLTADDGYCAIRSYSIAAAPEGGGVLELAIERRPDGEVSPFFHDIARIGDTIEVRGPLGQHFVWLPADRGPILLVGGGSGLVPLMAMVRHRAAAGSRVPFRLLLSARTLADVLYRDELEALVAREDGFGLSLAVTREAKKRPGDYGRRVDAGMMRDVVQSLPSPPARTFVCGANAFVNAAADGALAAGLLAKTISTERYGGT